MPPIARLTTLIFPASKAAASGSPQPNWPSIPVPRPLRTVESPIKNSVGRRGIARLGQIEPAQKVGRLVAATLRTSQHNGARLGDLHGPSRGRQVAKQRLLAHSFQSRDHQLGIQLAPASLVCV